MNKLDKAIEESKKLFTDEQENEVMNQDEPDVSFDVGFYRGLLEAKIILIKMINIEKEVI